MFVLSICVSDCFARDISIFLKLLVMLFRSYEVTIKKKKKRCTVRYGFYCLRNNFVHKIKVYVEILKNKFLFK